MDIRTMILEAIQTHGETSVAEIVTQTGLSRAYIHRYFRILQDEGRIVMVGKANHVRYTLSTPQAVLNAKSKILRAHRLYTLTADLSEDRVLDQLKRETGIFIGLKKNVSHIIDYVFTEILNNAIEHSRSLWVSVDIERSPEAVRFTISDQGIGVFSNIMKKKHLKSEMEAVDDLLKGKLTTAPAGHSGEGIFFSSKAVDTMRLQSHAKELVFQTLLDDAFLRDSRFRAHGTRVTCAIQLNSKRRLDTIFGAFADDALSFGTTSVTVRMYAKGVEYVSRSQARRIVSGLDRFKKVILDFKDVKTIGQGFADEIFRVWQHRHPKIRLIPKHMNENVSFMVNRTISR